MDRYIIIPSPEFQRAYKKLSPALQRQVDKQVDLLAENPHHPSLRAHKRRGEGEIWQARITINDRLFFLMEGETITLITVEPHAK